MLFKEYQYHLATPGEQRAMGGKQICPRCGQKKFVPYVDANGQVLDMNVGKCERVNNCQYDYRPKEFFTDNQGVFDAKQPRRPSRPIFRPQPRPTYIDGDTIFKPSVIATMNHRNNLVEYLKTIFDANTVNQMVRDYYIGTSKHFGGAATVFYQVDRYGKIHRGKVMQYNPANGKRVKEPFAMVTTVHKLMNLGDNLPPQCLFGEHLLPDFPDATVAIVESEKTAIIASGVFGDCIALACGGCGNLTAAMCEPLRGRDVVLFPDNGKFDEWSERGKQMCRLFGRLRIAAIMERDGVKDGDDIGDLILQCFAQWNEANSGQDVYIDFGLTDL